MSFHAARSLTLAGLTRALSDIATGVASPARRAADAAMAERAPRVLGRLVRRGARGVLMLPLEDIAARVYGIGQAPPGLTTERLLARAEAAYAGEKSRGRAGHWSHDFNRQLCLAEIVVALRARVRKPS